MNLQQVPVEKEYEFVHPWGARTANKIHAGLTVFLGVLAYPFRWLRSKVLRLPQLQAKFDAIADGKDEAVQVSEDSKLG